MWIAADVCAARSMWRQTVKATGLASRPTCSRPGRPPSRALCSPTARPIRAFATVAILLFLVACSDSLKRSEPPASGQLLRNNLSVASAALAAGQPAVAQRLYQSLTERYADAPEPVMGLGYIALHAGDFSGATRHFLKAADLGIGRAHV